MTDTDLLVAAIFDEDIQAVKTVLDGGVDVNATGGADDTPLHYAVFINNIEIVKLLLEYGADPNIMSNSDGTALHYAVIKDNTDIARLLISFGAGLNAISDDGESGIPLHYAMSKDMAIFLLENGADVNAQDSLGNTCLHAAIHNHQIAMCLVLIANGALIDARNCRGWSPLHEAVWEEQAEIVELLLDKGVHINSRTGYFSEHWLTPLKDIGGVQLKNGWTPLHVAVKKNSTLMIQLLIDKGADINVKLSDLGTPLHWAEELHNEEAAELLRKYNAPY